MAEFLDKSKVSEKLEFRQWAEQRSDLPIFYQPFWLDMVAGPRAWSVVLSKDQGGQINGILAYVVKKRFGIPFISHPPLTPRMGPWLIYPPNMQRHRRYDFEEKIINRLLDQLPRMLYSRIKCQPNLSNWYPFYKQGWQQTTAYTYQLDLSHSPSLWPQLEDKTRNKIRKAKNKLTLDQASNKEVLLQLLKQSFPKSSPYPIPIVERLVDQLDQRQLGQYYLAHDQEGQYHGALYLAYDQHCAYNLLLATNPNLRQSGAGAFLLWHAILDAARRVSIFDFEGSMIPGVERFFRGFGPDLMPYHVLEKWSIGGRFFRV